MKYTVLWDSRAMRKEKEKKKKKDSFPKGNTSQRRREINKRLIATSEILRGTYIDFFYTKFR
jgi:hypothetical protein